MGLSPLEIRKQEFKKAIWGFNKNDVELFQETVEATVNELLTENDNLVKRIEELKSRITKLENQSSAIQEAIELAKKEAQRIIDEAALQAERMHKKAQEEITNYQDELSLKTKEKKEELYKLQTLKDSFKQRFLYLLEEESKLLDDFEHEHQAKKTREILEGIGQHEIVSDPVSISRFLANSLHLRNRLLE